MMVGEGSAKMELASPKEMASDVEALQRKMMLGPEMLSQARLPIHGGRGCGLTSSEYAIILGERPAVCDMPNPSSRHICGSVSKLAALLHGLPDPPMTARLVTELKQVVELAEQSQVHRRILMGIARPG